MTRRAVVGVSLLIFLGAVAMSLSSTILPTWASWDTQTPYSKPIHYSYGLHTRCSSVTGTCTPFPRSKDCPDRTFCTLWRTAGFLMSLAIVFELTTMIAFGVLILGGKQTRQRGWYVLVGLLGCCAAMQIAAVGVVGWVFDNDERFIPGWQLGSCYWLCVASFAVQILIGAGVLVAKSTLPEEGGYDLIPDRA